MNKYLIIENGIEYNVSELENGIHWYYNKKHHREDGPAVELSNGTKWWYKHGNYHREDGPAIINSDGSKEYWLNHIRYPNINSDDEWIIFQIIT